MKIVFISSYFPMSTGGAEYQSYLLAKCLSKYYEVPFVSIVESGHTIPTDKFKVYPIYKREILRKILNRYFILDYKLLTKLLMRINPDIIYQRVGFAYTGIAARYSKQYNKKMIWHISSDNDVRKFRFHINRNILTDYIDKKCLEYGIKKTDYIVCQTKYQKMLLKRNYGKKCDLFLPNFHPTPTTDINKKPPLKILWIANIKHLKQPEYFINLAENFAGQHSLQFIMIGKGGNNMYMKHLSRKISKLDNLNFLGEKPFDEVNKILSGAHILVNTSKYEGFPNTFIQAWMRRVPVVSLDVDPDGVLEKNKIGFHSGTFEQMVKDVQLLIENEKLREEIGARALQYAFENHTIEKNINKIISLIEQII